MAAPNDTFEFPRTGKKARNRAVVAAMTNKQSNEDGTLSDEEINWLIRRAEGGFGICLLYTSPSPRDRTRSRMPSSA